MRGWKIAGIVLGSVLGLVVAALLLAWRLFDPNDYKDRMQSGFRAATGRELHLDGPLSLSIFPWLAVEMGKASVGNRAGFGDEAFASLERARLGVRLWPLLTQRRVEFGPVRVDGLTLRLAVARNGTNNWSDLLDRLSREGGTPRSEPRGEDQAAPRIASVTLREASVQFTDAEAGSRYAVEHWTLETGRLHPDTPFDLDTSLDAVRNGRALGHFELSTRVDLTHDGQVILAGTRGTAKWPRAGKPAFDVALSAPRVSVANATRDIDVEALEVRLGPAAVHATLAIRQGKTGPQANGRFELAETSPRKLLESLGTPVPRTADATVMQRVAARSNLRYSSAGGLQFDKLDLTLDDTRLTGQLAIAEFEQLPLRFTLRGDAIDLDRYLPPKAAGAPQTAAAAPTRATQGARDPDQPLDVRGTLAFGRVAVAGVPLGDVTADVSLRDRKLALAPLRARAFDGTTVAQVRYDLGAAVPTLTVEQQIRGVDVAAMLGQLLGVRQLQGRGDATFTVRTHGASAAELFANLAGPFELTVTDGALIGADLWFEIERAIAAAQLKKSAVTGKGLGRTEFDRLAARGTLANGTLRNDRLEFVTDFADVRGRGDVDYASGTLDLDLVAKLLRAPPGRFLGVKVSRVKGADIPLEVTGTLTEPEVRPDVSRLLEAIAKDALKQPFEGKVKEQLEKIFKF